MRNVWQPVILGAHLNTALRLKQVTIDWELFWYVLGSYFGILETLFGILLCVIWSCPVEL